MSLNFIISWQNDKWYNKRVLIWRFTLVLIKINYGQIGDQNGYQFGVKFKLVFCAKCDRGLDLGFWEILKPLKWTNITSFFLTKIISHVYYYINLHYSLTKISNFSCSGCFQPRAINFPFLVLVMQITKLFVKTSLL
jgi:hypothetical protein